MVLGELVFLVIITYVAAIVIGESIILIRYIRNLGGSKNGKNIN